MQFSVFFWCVLFACACVCLLLHRVFCGSVLHTQSSIFFPASWLNPLRVFEKFPAWSRFSSLWSSIRLLFAHTGQTLPRPMPPALGIRPWLMFCCACCWAIIPFQPRAWLQLARLHPAGRVQPASSPVETLHCTNPGHPPPPDPPGAWPSS